MRFFNDEVLSGDVSADIEGERIDARFVYQISFQAVATDSPSGTLKIEVSNDEGLIEGEAINWSPAPEDDSEVTISTAGTFLIPKMDVSYRWIRAFWDADPSPGTGTIVVRAKSNGF